MHTRLLLDSLNVGVVAIAPDWIVTEWTHTAARITGVPSDRVIGHDFWVAFPGARGTHMEQMLHDVLLDGRPRDFVLPGPVTAGPGTTFEVRAARGPEQHLVLGFRPISEPLAPESHAAQLVSAFEAERRLYALLFETLPTPAIILDPSGEIHGGNSLAAALLAVTEPARLRGRNITDWIPARERSDFEVALRAAVSAQRRLHLAFEVTGESTREVNAVVVNVDQLTSPPKLLFVATDVSHEALLQRKLLQADRLSQLGALVAGVAHELSNPLAAIAAFAEHLAAGAGEGDQRGSAEIIRSEALRAGRIIGTLLDFARQRPRLHQPLDLNDVVHRVLALQRSALKKARVRVEVAIAADVPPVMGDPQELQQVLLNAVVNAHQAIAATGMAGRITITARHADDHVAIGIQDSGPGVPPALLARVFEPFFTTKGEAGSGLGLAISLGLVRAMGGRIWMQNIQGSGALLEIELPAGSAPLPEPRSSEFRIADRPLALLLVEDEPAVRRGMTLMARRLGHVVTSAGSLAEAEHFLATTPEAFEAFLLDVHLDEHHTGFELYDRLRAQGRGLEQRVVFTTGDSISSHTRERLERAARPVLRKPFDLNDLRAVLNRIEVE